MANTPQAKKRIRRNERRRLINHARKSRVRTFIKKVEQAIAAGDAQTAKAAFEKAEPEIRRAAAKGVLHRNTASRQISRLASKIARLSA